MKVFYKILLKGFNFKSKINILLVLNMSCIMLFKLFIDKKDDEPDPLEILMNRVKANVKSNMITLKTYNINDPEGAEEAEKNQLDEVPALLFDKIRISGVVNEYFIQAIIAQLITDKGDDRVGAKIKLSKNDANKLYIASAFLMQQTFTRNDTKNFLFMIRGSPNEVNTKELEKFAENNTTVFFLANFEEGGHYKKMAKLGVNENVLNGHIMRKNIHMTLVVTLRKNRPFFGSYIRTKELPDGTLEGSWSPLLHDTVKEMKSFYVPLFMTSSPIHIDGIIPENETNRLVAKVKDNMDIIKALFF